MFTLLLELNVICGQNWIRNDRIVDFYYPILSCFWKMISVSDPNPVLVETILTVSDNYPKVYCDAQHTFLCCVCFASWGKITAGVILPLTEHDWGSHKTSLEHMSCLVDHDISNSSPQPNVTVYCTCRMTTSTNCVQLKAKWSQHSFCLMKQNRQYLNALCILALSCFNRKFDISRNVSTFPSQLH